MHGVRGSTPLRACWGTPWEFKGRNRFLESHKSPCKQTLIEDHRSTFPQVICRYSPTLFAVLFQDSCSHQKTGFLAFLCIYQGILRYHRQFGLAFVRTDVGTFEKMLAWLEHVGRHVVSFCSEMLDSPSEDRRNSSDNWDFLVFFLYSSLLNCWLKLAN